MNTMLKEVTAGIQNGTELQLNQQVSQVQNIDIESVNRRWLAVLAKDANNELALIQLASNLINIEEIEDAEKYLHQLDGLSSINSSDRFQALKGRIAAIREDHEAVILHWDLALKHGHDETHCRQRIANANLMLGKIEKAIEQISAMERKGPLSGWARIIKARCFMREQKWQLASVILEDLDSFGSHRSSAARLLFHCYMNDYRNASATRLCQLLEQDESPDSYHLHGQLLFRENMYASALEKFSQAIALDGGLESRIWLIKTLTSIHDDGGAAAQIKLLEKTENVDPLVQGRCWEAAAVLSKAEECYLLAQKQTKTLKAYHALVKFYHTYRRWDKAYLAILQAQEHGIRSETLDSIANEIESAYRVSGKDLPTPLQAFGHAAFKSTEEMVSAIVDRIVERRKIPETIVVGRNTKNIVLVIGSLGAGGAERQVVNLANGLVQQYQDVTVTLLCTHLNRKEQDRFYEPQVSSKVKIIEYYDKRVRLEEADVPALAAYSEFLPFVQPESRRQTLLHLARSLSAIGPDVVHGWLDETFINTALVSGMLGIENSVGRWGSMPAGVSRIVNERDNDNVEYLNYAYSQIARIPDIKYSSNSRMTGDAYAALLGICEEDVEIVYNGVDHESLASHARESHDIRAQLSIAEDALVVGTVFRISEEKRPELWVEVAVEISRVLPDVHFVLVGGGPLEGTVEDLITERGLQNFHMVGKQTNVGAWYSVFDILLLTSRVEGVSNVVVEAQMCGCPVIAPAVGGLPEAILNDETGYLLKDDSVEGVAERVVNLLQNSVLRRQMGEAALLYAREKFSTTQMITHYKGLFDRV